MSGDMADMRLWTVHPRYLDPQGLVAAWREALLARKVLLGQTMGYRHHPQLWRFRQAPDPMAAIARFLRGLLDEAMRRGYQFDGSKVAECSCEIQLTETQGQLLYEWSHLRRKLRQRRPVWYGQVASIERPDAHPLFNIVPGDIAQWERRDAIHRPEKYPIGSRG